MLGLMQSQPLLISSLIEFAERHHGDGEIVSRRVEGDIHRYTYRDLAARSRQLANALDKQGLAFSDRVATLAWNGYRHMEMYLASVVLVVLHTINPRLHPEQIAWIINHAEDQVLCFDMTFPAPGAGGACQVPPRSRSGWRCVMPTSCRQIRCSGSGQLRGVDCTPSTDYAWPQFDENTASSMCATPVAPRATPKPPCTATVRPRCTPMPPHCLM